ncbi:MAG: ester cyclase [Methylophagaceae bacterium]
MATLDFVKQYFAAWNAHDADAIVKLFVDGGTYSDPSCSTLTGKAIGEYAKGLWTAFPDLSFECLTTANSDNNVIAAEWLMTGTNTQPFMGMPPTNTEISVFGADFFTFTADAISSVTGYFDPSIVPKQLGLQVITQPNVIGPFSFGTSVSVQTGKRTKPGAFSVTLLEYSDEQTDEFSTLSRDTAAEMLAMDGFIGANLMKIGGKGYTVSAWEKPEQTKQLMTSPIHKKAMTRRYQDLGGAGYASVWTPFYISALKVRCDSCSAVTDPEKNKGICDCGQLLPEAPPYF